MQDAILSSFRDGGNLLAAILFLIKNIRFNFEISKDTSFYIQSVASKYIVIHYWLLYADGIIVVCVYCIKMSLYMFIGRVSEPRVCEKEQYKVTNSMTLVHNRCQ
jgi:hypothetical protein